MDATSATLIAALVAALASTLGLALRIRADSRAELRRANRDRLEPILEEIGDALHKIVACSVLAVRDAGTENRRYFDLKKREARDVLRRLRPRVRYQLWGLDDGLKTLMALPDWVDARGVKDHDQLLIHASALRLAIDQAIRKAYRNGGPPSALSQIRVRICVRRMWRAWGGLQEALDRESMPLRRETVIHPKTRATIVRRDGEILTVRSNDGTVYPCVRSEPNGKGKPEPGSTWYRREFVQEGSRRLLAVPIRRETRVRSDRPARRWT